MFLICHLICSCAPVGQPKGCTVTKPDFTKEYPKCCPQLICNRDDWCDLINIYVSLWHLFWCYARIFFYSQIFTIKITNLLRVQAFSICLILNDRRSGKFDKANFTAPIDFQSIILQTNVHTVQNEIQIIHNWSTLKSFYD